MSADLFPVAVQYAGDVIFQSFHHLLILSLATCRAGLNLLDDGSHHDFDEGPFKFDQQGWGQPSPGGPMNNEATGPCRIRCHSYLTHLELSGLERLRTSSASLDARHPMPLTSDCPSATPWVSVAIPGPDVTETPGRG